MAPEQTSSKPRKQGAARLSQRRAFAVRDPATGQFVVAGTVMEEARRSGLLDGERTEHVSFRVPKALLDAAKRESGVSSPTELGLLALAMLAQPDPVARFLKNTHGKLGADHTLDY